MSQRPDSPEASLSLSERVLAATELLEQFAVNRAELLEISDDDRNRLLKAAGEVSRPDAILRREEFNAGRRRMQARGVRSDDPGQWWGYGPSIG